MHIETTNEISAITDKLLKKDAEASASAKKNVGSGRLKTEPNKARGAGVRGKSSKPLVRNKTTANLKATSTTIHSSNRKGALGSSTTFNSKPKGNSAIKTSKSLSRLQKEDNKSTPVKQSTDKGSNGNKKAIASSVKTSSTKSNAKIGKDLGNDIDKADTKRKDNKKEITTITEHKEENAQEDNAKKAKEKIATNEEASETPSTQPHKDEETAKPTEMSEHHKAAMDFISAHKLFYKPTMDIATVNASSLKTVLSDIAANFKAHLEDTQNAITSLKQVNIHYSYNAIYYIYIVHFRNARSPYRASPGVRADKGLGKGD